MSQVSFDQFYIQKETLKQDLLSLVAVVLTLAVARTLLLGESLMPNWQF